LNSRADNLFFLDDICDMAKLVALHNQAVASFLGHIVRHGEIESITICGILRLTRQWELPIPQMW
jgi:hypothetical protein